VPAASRAQYKARRCNGALVTVPNAGGAGAILSSSLSLLLRRSRACVIVALLSAALSACDGKKESRGSSEPATQTVAQARQSQQPPVRSSATAAPSPVDAIQPAGTEPPQSAAPVRASFDCEHARKRVEILICSDSGLAAADRELVRLYHTALAKAADENAVRAEQNDWIALRRDVCDSRACLAATYAQRRRELRTWTGP
jgi:uncharacterized protein YecT (DUF1311 family)